MKTSFNGLCLLVIKSICETNFFNLLDFINDHVKAYDKIIDKIENKNLYTQAKHKEKKIVFFNLRNKFLQLELDLIHKDLKTLVFIFIKFNLVIKRKRGKLNTKKLHHNEGSILSLFNNENVVKAEFAYNHIFDDSIIRWTVYECLDIRIPKVEYQNIHIKKFCLDILNALKSLNKESYVHLDLKPENILVYFKNFCDYNMDYRILFYEYINRSIKKSEICKDNVWRIIFKLNYNLLPKKGIILNCFDMIKAKFFAKEILPLYLNSEFFDHTINSIKEKNSKADYHVILQKVYIKKDNTIEKKFFIYIKSELNFFVFCNKKIPDFIDPFNLFDYVTELKSFATLNLYNLDCQNIEKDYAVQKNCSNLQYKDSKLYFHKNCINMGDTDEILYFKTAFVIKNLDGSKSNYIEKCFDLISYKLINFDLAKKYVPNKINKVDTRFGTFPEIAPEIYKDSYYTQYTDIWNLGLLALELLQPSKDNLEKEAKAEDIRNGKILSLINNDNLIASFIIVCLKVNPTMRTSPENLKKFLENNNLN